MLRNADRCSSQDRNAEDPTDALQNCVATKRFEDRWRRPLTDAIISSLHEAWYQDVRYARVKADVAKIDANWIILERLAYKEISELLEKQDAVVVADRVAAESEHLDYEMSKRVSRYWAGGAS